MRKFIAVLLLALAMVVLPQPGLAAHAEREAMADRGEALCSPGRYAKFATDGCLHLGPVHYLSRLAALGITFPLRPLPARPPDYWLTEVPFQYARVTAPYAPVYASPEDAARGKNPLRTIAPGFDFVSYTDQTVEKGLRVYGVGPGEWMAASDLSRVTPSTFQGQAFSRTPERSFGWVLQPVQTQRTPGATVDPPSPPLVRGAGGIRWLSRYEVVQVYAVEQVGEADWYLIRPDEWVEGSQIARVLPNPNPPEGVENGRWIEVNLDEQTLAAYDQGQLVYATLVSSGLPGTWTQPGLFQIYVRLEVEFMTGGLPGEGGYYYLEDVPWTMYFDQSRALHGTYWHNNFGTPRSRGCVNLAIGDARWLFDWAQVGDWVYVWDPSGQTPTDPALYDEGGA